MSGRPEWFAPTRYGYGSGLPIAWQGWAVLIVYAAVAIVIGVLLEDKPIALVGALLFPTFLVMLICARTTKGGWRWRWGQRD